MIERVTRLARDDGDAHALAIGQGSSARDAQHTTAAAGQSIHAVAIDVRSEREFQAVAIEHAINLPLPHLEHRIRTLVPDTSTPLVLYCASGARSAMACMLLAQMGYTSVVNAGGLHTAAALLKRDLRR